jgi:hypothetical protein
MNGFNWLRKLLKSERGNVIVIGAATIPLLIGAGAVGMDTIQLGLWKRQLQRAADSAALAGGRALVQKMVVPDAVRRDLLLNNQVPLLGAPVIQPPPLAGRYMNNPKAVRVVLRSQQNLPFWSFFTGSSPTLETSATAMIVTAGEFCMMALEDRNATAIVMSGNSKLNLGCGIAANSRSSIAIDAKGSTEINATTIMAFGGLDPENSKFGNAEILPHSDLQQDPFASRPDPSTMPGAQGPCIPAVPVEVNGKLQLSEGCYSEFDLNDTITLAPGTYYIKDTLANFGSRARISGEGVTLVFTGEGDNIGKFDMDGQATLTLTAPPLGSDADYPGMVLLRDPSRLTMDILQINGGQELKLEGAMYFPKTRLYFNGNSDVSARCLQIVAQQLEFKGGANITNDCSGGNGEGLPITYVRLVE